MRSLKTLSCFAGIGGFSYGAKILGGFNTDLAIEIDPFRQQILQKNFPGIKIHDDICTYTANPEDNWDVLISTFPCRGTSVAGKREGFKNKYSGLWWESYRLIKECRPKFIIIENVRGFIKKGLRECLDGLRVAGYVIDGFEIISAKEVGSPQLRERVFIVAYDVKYAHSIEGRGKPTCWSRQIGKAIETVRNHSERMCFQPFSEGIHHGTNPWLDQYWRLGWWQENAYTEPVAVPKRSIPDRQKRLSALGDMVVPHQAIIPLMRVKYLQEFFEI